MNDILLSITAIIVSYSLVPQIIKSIKEKQVMIDLQTIILTIVALMINSGIMFNLKLYFSGITTSLTCISWVLYYF